MVFIRRSLYSIWRQRLKRCGRFFVALQIHYIIFTFQQYKMVQSADEREKEIKQPIQRLECLMSAMLCIAGCCLFSFDCQRKKRRYPRRTLLYLASNVYVNDFFSFFSRLCRRRRMSAAHTHDVNAIFIFLFICLDGFSCLHSLLLLLGAYFFTLFLCFFDTMLPALYSIMLTTANVCVCFDLLLSKLVRYLYECRRYK